ncbi:hypothetical protein Tco_1236518 [Tanacetum coccineum]
MFERGSYNSHDDHEMLYNALEISMDHDRQDELHKELSRSRKRDPEDTDNAHLPKMQTQATWFRPIPEEDRSATPEPEWTIHSNDFPEPENNWANVFATTYQDL